MPHIERPAFALSIGSAMFEGFIPNEQFISDFTKLLRDRIETSRQLTAIVTGAGPIARVYIESLKKSGIVDQDTLDSNAIGITRHNARYLRDKLKASGIRVKHTAALVDSFPKNVDILVTGGTKPGQTTDAVAVDWARILGYRTVINITNTPYVYEYCPDGKTPDIDKPIREMTYDYYLTLVGPDHVSGENVPAGRKGIQKAKKYGMVFNVVGPDLDNVRKIFEEKPFVGTRIHA